MGKTLAGLVNGRDVGVRIEVPKCMECGAEMKFEGYCGWNIHGLEGDSRLERGKPSASEPHSDPQVTLHRHSYQVGLWTADEIGQHQYLEGTRRQVESSARLGSPNDGAVWINHITTTNYPQIIYSIDWAHASGRLSNVGKAAFGDGTTQAQRWTDENIERLWHGRIAEVVTALHALNWEHISCLDDIRHFPPTLKAAKLIWITPASAKMVSRLVAVPLKAASILLFITA